MRSFLEIHTHHNDDEPTPPITAGKGKGDSKILRGQSSGTRRAMGSVERVGISTKTTQKTGFIYKFNTKQPTHFFLSIFSSPVLLSSPPLAMSQDDWIKSAFKDDSLVADVLVRLRVPPPVLLEWGVRQPRSRQIVRFKGELTRASPTTPLSWSAGTSNSGGGDGCEESSARLNNARSKAITPGENNTKRSRKKTFAQLKEQESFLLKEGIDLKRALAVEHILYERQKLKCESLKRLKLDLHLQSSAKKPIINQSYPVVVTAIDQTTEFLPPTEKCKEMDLVFRRSDPVSDFSNAQGKESMQQESHRVLPDLNLLPDLNIPFDEELN